MDTSALVAIAQDEAGAAELLEAIFAGEALIPAPVLVEYERVVTERGAKPNPAAARVLARVLAQGAKVAAFGIDCAGDAVGANATHGQGNGRGGTLNLLDLMVFGMAQRLSLPILCTGRDFHEAGAALHPASRIDEC